jgi:hypothetical protein
MGIDWKWLVIGILLGALVLGKPIVQAFDKVKGAV